MVISKVRFKQRSHSCINLYGSKNVPQKNANQNLEKNNSINLKIRVTQNFNSQWNYFC